MQWMILNVTYPNSNLLKPTKKGSCKLYRPRANAADNCAGSPNELAISLDTHTIYPRSVYKKKPCRDERGKGSKKTHWFLWLIGSIIQNVSRVEIYEDPREGATWPAGYWVNMLASKVPLTASSSATDMKERMRKEFPRPLYVKTLIKLWQLPSSGIHESYEIRRFSSSVWLAVPLSNKTNKWKIESNSRFRTFDYFQTTSKDCRRLSKFPEGMFKVIRLCTHLIFANGTAGSLRAGPLVRVREIGED